MTYSPPLIHRQNAFHKILDAEYKELSVKNTNLDINNYIEYDDSDLVVYRSITNLIDINDSNTASNLNIENN
jgi:hypothetical protein